MILVAIIVNFWFIKCKFFEFHYLISQRCFVSITHIFKKSTPQVILLQMALCDIIPLRNAPIGQAERLVPADTDQLRSGECLEGR